MRLSFVIPAYNRAWCLSECLDSILSQRGADDEIIVVDDGSTDKTPAVLEQYTGRGVRSLRLPGNSGPAGARNAGMREARGEYLVFLDSDDRLLPGGLETLRKRIQKTGSAFVGYWFNCIGSENGRPTGAAPRDRYAMTYEDLLAGEKVGGEFLPVIRRAEFAHIGYFEQCRGGEDLTWLEVLRRHGPFHICLTPVRWYRQHAPDSLLEEMNRATNEAMHNMLVRAELFLERFGEDARRVNPRRVRDEHFRAAYAAVFLHRFETAETHLEALRTLNDTPIRVRVLRTCCTLRSRLPQTMLRGFGRVIRRIRAAALLSPPGAPNGEDTRP